MSSLSDPATRIYAAASFIVATLVLGACGAGGDRVSPVRPARASTAKVDSALWLDSVSYRGTCDTPGVLRVCADPNNLPFSNRRGEGFENHIAETIAKDLGLKLRYTWWAQRRGFFRNTLNACLCDVVIGTPTATEMAQVTRPYYRSTYVFVTRSDRHLGITSFDDPRLHKLRIGVQTVGDDFANTPPVHALSRRGVAGNVIGYSLYGDYSKPNPPARIIDAVADGEVDVAIAWGPMASYFARRARVPLDVAPVAPAIDKPYLPFTFDISMAVRRADTVLRDRLADFLDRRQEAIDSILDAYGVPRAGGSRPNSAGVRHVSFR